MNDVELDCAIQLRRITLERDNVMKLAPLPAAAAIEED
jgi:hypothetical protein